VTKRAEEVEQLSAMLTSTTSLVHSDLNDIDEAQQSTGQELVTDIDRLLEHCSQTKVCAAVEYIHTYITICIAHCVGSTEYVSNQNISCFIWNYCLLNIYTCFKNPNARYQPSRYHPYPILIIIIKIIISDFVNLNVIASLLMDNG